LSNTVKVRKINYLFKEKFISHKQIYKRKHDIIGLFLPLFSCVITFAFKRCLRPFVEASEKNSNTNLSRRRVNKRAKIIKLTCAKKLTFLLDQTKNNKSNQIINFKRYYYFFKSLQILILMPLIRQRENEVKARRERTKPYETRNWMKDGDTNKELKNKNVRCIIRKSEFRLQNC